MRLRLLAKFNADMGLVQETCCTVVDFELHEQDPVSTLGEGGSCSSSRSQDSSRDVV